METPDEGMADVVGSTADPGALAESCWTAKRLRIRAWLQRSSPQLAQIYAGAVTMVSASNFPGRLVFVWHAMRELYNRLPDAVAGEVASSSLQYGQLAGDVQQCWLEDGQPNDGETASIDPSEPSASGPPRYEVSRDLLVAVGRLVGGHAAIANRNEADAQRLFAAVAGSDVPVPAYVVRTWRAGARGAHKLAHVRNKPVDPEYEASLESDFAAFEAMLMVFVNRSYENMDDLDEILGSANR